MYGANPRGAERHWRYFPYECNGQWDLGDASRTLPESRLTLAVSPCSTYFAMDQGDVVGVEEALRHSEVAAEKAERSDQLDLVFLNGLLRRQQGKWETARQGLDRALALAREMSMPWYEAHALAELGRIHADRGQPEEAASHFRAALLLCERIGASTSAELVQRDLDALERR